MRYKTRGCHSFIVIIESIPTIRLLSSFLTLQKTLALEKRYYLRMNK
jgi:hypothetical protein